MTSSRLTLLGFIAVLIAAFFIFDLQNIQSFPGLLLSIQKSSGLA